MTKGVNLANFPLPESAEKNGRRINRFTPSAGDYYEKNISAKQYLQKEKARLQSKNGHQGRQEGPERQETQRTQASGALDLVRRRLKRVRESWHFRKILRNGRQIRGSVLRIRYTMNSLGRIRLGFSVSAKTGKSVERNLFKRRLRQYSVEKEVERGFDAVVFPEKKLVDISWIDLKEDMDMFVERVRDH